MPSDYEGPTDNKFDGTANPSHPGEKYDVAPAIEPNKFPRESYEDGDAVTPLLSDPVSSKSNYGRP